MDLVRSIRVISNSYYHLIKEKSEKNKKNYNNHAYTNTHAENENSLEIDILVRDNLFSDQWKMWNFYLISELNCAELSAISQE